MINNRVLLIYNEYPEWLTIYDLAVNNEEEEWLKQCHGVYANSSIVPDNHPIEKLHDWLQTKKEAIIYSEENDLGKIQADILILTGRRLIVAGFAL